MYRKPLFIASLYVAIWGVAGCFHDLDIFDLDGAAASDRSSDSPPLDRGHAGKEGGPDKPLCAAPKLHCGGACIDPSSSTSHCGACDKACKSSYTCQTGTCVCPSPRKECGGQCVDLSTTSHCGSCNNACPSSFVCQQGKCVCDSKAAFSCSGSTSQYCKQGLCAPCAKAVFNCDGKSDCECVGKCSGGKCKNTCTYGKSGQCGSIYHACTHSGKCELCKKGYKNCDQHGGCATPESQPCP